MELAPLASEDVGKGAGRGGVGREDGAFQLYVNVHANIRR